MSGRSRQSVGSTAVVLLLAALTACSGSPPPEPPTPSRPSPTVSTADGIVVTTVYTTAYTWFDNTPPGSSSISYPVLHRTAGGTGTYGDPVTVAVGHSKASGKDVPDFSPGTRIYLPDVRRYFMVEDSCGDGPKPEDGPCHQGRNADGSGSTIWLDVWIGGEGGTAREARRCASRVTGPKGTMHTAVFNPARDFAVAPGKGVFHDGTCDVGYGNELVKGAGAG
ncbi:hypothetical protein KIH31_17330 [Paenarthrobacter sp. DKR-5]|nr:hypothetical protein [Paenarthrobacter sp. DKR-5]